ncbi:hypothetical protein [Roseicella frigidaeris]|uniref:Uncharacterized protein n=1 Tax=Roseicella frigidaeris TaxID=2230885 RepID=A0A327M0N6_9PROT|nr:hypothetical protein [Roseicella frigidaeris]RAI55977.1 hypothetical protein DOO78_23290 [Roseicella frigidaeris]
MAALALLLLLPGLAGAQDAPRAGAAARPNAGPVGPGMGPLQTEPGDIWAEVRGWTRQMDKTEAPAKPRCVAGTAGCGRKPTKARNNPG